MPLDGYLSRADLAAHTTDTWLLPVLPSLKFYRWKQLKGGLFLLQSKSSVYQRRPLGTVLLQWEERVAGESSLPSSNRWHPSIKQVTLLSSALVTWICPSVGIAFVLCAVWGEPLSGVAPLGGSENSGCHRHHQPRWWLLSTCECLS